MTAFGFLLAIVRDRWRLRRAMDGCEAVIHAAALKRIEVSVYNPVEMKKTNEDGSDDCIEAARDAGVKKCILVSTDKVKF
jgi:UDP-N-acetylglucosamine 4,6-dehydratase/5-epimerase